MAFQKPFTADSGIELQSAYWRPTRISLDLERGSNLSLRFSGYASKALRKAGKSCVAGAVKDYNLSGDDTCLSTLIETLYPEGIVGVSVADLITRFGYMVAKDIKDVVTPSTDPTTPPELASFFEDAPTA